MTNKILSYAQAMEDMHLALLFEGQGAGVYVDIGGNHPVADNVSFQAYLAGWRGLVIEPQTDLAARHRAVRPRDVVVECLAGRGAGEAQFHKVVGLHGLSTMMPAGAETIRDAHGAAIETITLPVVPLADLLARHIGGPIAWMKIDVEGAEAEVIAGNDWARFRPQVVVVEAMHPVTFQPSHETFAPALLAGGYRDVFFDGLNRFYIAEEAIGLAARLPEKPLAWDGVRHLWDHGKAPERGDHPDHALAAALGTVDWAALPFADLEALARQLVAAAQTPVNALRLVFGTEPAPPLSRADLADVPAMLAQALAAAGGCAARGRIAAAYDGGFAE